MSKPITPCEAMWYMNLPFNLAMQLEVYDKEIVGWANKGYRFAELTITPKARVHLYDIVKEYERRGYRVTSPLSGAYWADDKHFRVSWYPL